MTTLLDKSRKDEYVVDIKEDYEDIRDDHCSIAWPNGHDSFSAADCFVSICAQLGNHWPCRCRFRPRRHNLELILDAWLDFYNNNNTALAVNASQFNCCTLAHKQTLHYSDRWCTLSSCAVCFKKCDKWSTSSCYKLWYKYQNLTLRES